MSTVLGVRHGEVHNPTGVIYAGLDGYGLSDVGRRQARAVGEALRDAKVAALYASPLDRAVQTAAAISEATGVPVVTDDRLYEWRFWSRWAGLTWEELREKARDDWTAYREDPGSVTAGESLAQLAARTLSWLEEASSAHPDGLIVAVTHLEPLRAALLNLTNRPPKDLFSIEIGLGEVVRLRPNPEPVPVVLASLRSNEVR